MPTDPRRALPSVDALLAMLAHRDEPRSLITSLAREVLAGARTSSQPETAPATPDNLAREVEARLDALARPSLRRVINASGVILQTNLGRAPLSKRALAAMADVAAASNLEYDLAAGERGSRHEHVRSLLRRATGAEDAIAVNNNAAALLMVLQVFCAGRQVLVSRGQSVEIGGGFRIPDVLRQSGAILVDVGTTNRTYVRDYVDAIQPETAAILRVHASNFQTVGFTTEPSARELAEAARRAGILCIDDLGSGCLVATERFGLAHEPTVQESLAGGVDLALFSGDKLLGGPQAGLIVGKSHLIEQLRKHPLARALRMDKFGIAALNATLLSYVLQTEADEIPVWQMLGRELASIRKRARRWASPAGEAGTVRSAQTMVGGGSLPGQGVDTWCAALRHPDGATNLAARLRADHVPVIGRVVDELLLLDPRTVDPADDSAVEAAITSVFRPT